MAERRRPHVSDDGLIETVGQTGQPSLSTQTNTKPARGQFEHYFTKLLILLTVGTVVFLVAPFCTSRLIDYYQQKSRDVGSGRPLKEARGFDGSSTNNKPQAAANYRLGASKTLRGDDHKQDMGLPVLVTFTNVKENPNLRPKLELCITSMFRHTSVDLSILVIGDPYSQDVAASIIKTAAGLLKNDVKYKLVALDVDSLTAHLHQIIRNMQKFFSEKPGAYYGQALFFLSLAIHKVMPSNLNKVIMLDADLKFEADIAELFGHFDRFTNTNIIGIAREMQPVYRHVFHMYRYENPSTRVGNPPPDGLTGFNSGVLLLNVDRMRKSKLYNELLEPDVIRNLTVKYKFQGHLGDQDFFTLLSLEHEELFYVLPCTWNRQLCQWWKDKGYEDVFEDYFRCEGKVNIFHGNCHTPIPS